MWLYCAEIEKPIELFCLAELQPCGVFHDGLTVLIVTRKGFRRG